MALTFLVVVIGWVFFRAENFDAALAVLRGMAGLNSGVLSDMFHWRLMQMMGNFGIHFGSLSAPADLKNEEIEGLWLWISTLWALAWFAPNTQQIMAGFKPALENVTYGGRLRWRLNNYWLGSIAVGLLYAITEMGKVSEFLYFQF